MGTDAILKLDGKEVAWLGRVSQFTDGINYSNELDTNWEQLEHKEDLLNKKLLSNIQKLVFFVAGKRDIAEELGLSNDRGNWEELTKGELYDILLEDIEQYIEYVSEELVDIGKKKLLGSMLDDNEDLSVGISY